MEEKTGVARLRQAIENQSACGGGQFELSIDSADGLCREIEDQMARLAWAGGAPDRVAIPPVRPFAGVTADKALALKPLEEASEVLEAWKRWDRTGAVSDGVALMDECADVVQATCNLVAAFGYGALWDAMARCERRNRARGRYAD